MSSLHRYTSNGFKIDKRYQSLLLHPVDIGCFLICHWAHDVSQLLLCLPVIFLPLLPQVSRQFVAFINRWGPPLRLPPLMVDNHQLVPPAKPSGQKAAIAGKTGHHDTSELELAGKEWGGSHPPGLSRTAQDIFKWGEGGGAVCSLDSLCLQI